MDMNLEGRLRNINLPHNQTLLPVYEALFNSFHAIEDAAKGAGKITIRIGRDMTQQLLKNKEGSVAESPVKSVHITDTGIGFSDENLRSFKTADTQFKLTRGGKGVGRFMWLKAFSRVRIESVIDDGGERIRRTFMFSSPVGVTNEKDETAPQVARATTVHLLDILPEYQRHFPRRLDIVARKIIEHALIYLLRPAAPQLTLQDEQDSVDVSAQFREIIAGADERSFDVKGNALHIRTFKLYRSDDPRHRLHVCAEDREVTSEPLAPIIPDLARRLTDEDGKPFVISSYVSGDVLDNTVTPDRLDFGLIESAGDELMTTTLTKEDVRRGAAAQIREFLKPQLDVLREEKHAQVRRFVESQAPEYRPILSYKPEYIEQIPPGLTDEKLDAELHRITYRVESELREQARTILDQEKDDVQIAEEQLRRFIEEENAFGKSRLAAYVGHRKVVLEFLERRLGVSDTGKRPHESAIHELVFPLKSTSSDVPFEQQNLWLIDERLAYHKYLASDLPLNQTEGVDIDGTKRPDLLIFQGPFLFVETDPPFPAAVIIEFKRPMRDDYDDKENPITQVYDYVDRIKTGKTTDRTGMQVAVPPTTPFYCYIVANVTPKLQRWARYAGLTPTPDAGGFFGYNQDLGTYVEIIAYPKVLADAKKRNRILFEKLNLPDRLG